MDPLSMAASVAGVAATGVQLSQTIYELISTYHDYHEAEKEMSSIANDISLLAMVLDELEGILRRDSRVYRRRMVRVVNEILDNCEGVFENISKHVSVNPQDKTTCEQFQSEICWYFQRHRIRPLQVGLESMKSTLNVLLHVVHLARVTEVAESFIPNAGTVFTHADVQMERRILVGVVLDNRRSIWNLTQIGEDRDKGQEPRNIVEDKLETKVTDSGEALGDNAPIIERNFGQRETTGSGGFSSFGGRGDSSANTGTNTSLFSKATKDAPTDTTCSNTGLIGVIKEKQKDKITVPGFDMKKPSTFDEKQDHEVEDISAGTLGVVFAQDKKSKGKEEKNHQRQEEMEYHNWGPRDALPDSCGPARSASHLEHVVELYKVPKAGLSGHRSESFHGRLEMRHTTGAHHTTSPSGSHVASLSQSPASVYYSMASEIPIVGGIKPDYSEEDIRDMRQYTASAKGLGTRFSKSQGSPRDSKTVTPTVSWFLSIVPHESSVPALVVRPCSVDANSLRARAEETAKTLLLRWTNVDPEVVSGEDGLDGWNATSVSSSHPHGPAGDGENANQPCQVSSTPQIYPTYAPQRWYLPPVSTPPPPPNEKQSDIEELARLKKLILDEKAEQDMMAVAAAAAAAAAAAPPGALVAPMITEELPEDTLQRENTHIEAVDSMQMSQEYNVLWKAEPPRLPPVIMRDWLGRKFIFPVDMCQTWEGLGNLIQEAFGRMHEYRPMIEQGCYNISHITGEVILPSTWESFVHPGLDIQMEISHGFDADRREPDDKTMVGERRDKAGPKQLISLHAPEMLTLRNPTANRSGSDDEPSIDIIADDETDCSFPDGISYVERSDPRYLSIENAILEQKKAKVKAELRLERNRRFFYLKQQLVNQGAAIQARQDAADHAEQDTKLAWLEKQVRDQKEELDTLPPLLATPSSSSAGDSLSKSASSPQRRPSFGARLLGRMPSRGIRSQGSIRSQQMIAEG